MNKNTILILSGFIIGFYFLYRYLPINNFSLFSLISITVKLLAPLCLLLGSFLLIKIPEKVLGYFLLGMGFILSFAFNISSIYTLILLFSETRHEGPFPYASLTTVILSIICLIILLRDEKINT